MSSGLLVNWYNKLVVAVRWQGSLSDPFIVQSSVRQGSSLFPAIFNIFINAFIVKLRESNSDCCINGAFVGCVMYANDIILISASVNGLQSLLNCYHTVSLDLLLKFNCVKSTCIAIGLRSSFNISNMQLGDDFISWSNKLKYLGVMFNVAKTLSIYVDVMRRKFSAACNCLLGNSIHQNEILKLCLQESYILPVLQYACSAISFTKSQLNYLNVCWNFVYRRIFGFCKFEPVHCLVAGLGRLDFLHFHLLLTLKFIKCVQCTSNTVFKALMGIYTQSSAFSLLLKSANLLMVDFVKLPVHALNGFIIDLFRVKNDL